MATPIPCPVSSPVPAPTSTSIPSTPNLSSGSGLSGLVGTHESERGANASSSPQALARQSEPIMTLHVPSSIQAISSQEHQWYRNSKAGHTIRMPDIKEIPELSALQENAEAENTQEHKSRLGELPYIQMQEYDSHEYINHQKSRKVSGGRLNRS